MNELISLEKIAQWQKLKTLVLDSVSSPITKRVYNMGVEIHGGDSSRRRGVAREVQLLPRKRVRYGAFNRRISAKSS